MIIAESIKGIIFDYGGTLDTDSLHWSEVLWMGYQHTGIPVTKEEFRKAYVFAERELARLPYIKPEHTFLDLLKTKVDIELSALESDGAKSPAQHEDEKEQIVWFCYNYVLKNLEKTRPVLEQLKQHYPIVLVSNFYGNLNAVLKDFELDRFFDSVIESAVVGVRKPDPEIFTLGVKELGLLPEEVVVIGDSLSKDIIPATTIGCKSVWISGKGWDADEPKESTIPTRTIHSISELILM